MTDDERHELALYKRHGLRPPRGDYYSWADRDADIEAAIEPYSDHPTIVATLSFVRDNGMHGGIHIDRWQAQEIIDWLAATLNHPEQPADRHGTRKDAR